MKCLRHAEVLDAFRVVPRILICGYGWMLWRISEWAMSLPDLSGGQSAFVATVWGASAGVFGLYVNTGRHWEKERP